LDLDLSRGHFN